MAHIVNNNTHKCIHWASLKATLFNFNLGTWLCIGNVISVNKQILKTEHTLSYSNTPGTSTIQVWSPDIQPGLISSTAPIKQWGQGSVQEGGNPPHCFSVIYTRRQTASHYLSFTVILCTRPYNPPHSLSKHAPNQRSTVLFWKWAWCRPLHTAAHEAANDPRVAHHVSFSSGDLLQWKGSSVQLWPQPTSAFTHDGMILPIETTASTI